jgi:VWFA-related protein
MRSKRTSEIAAVIIPLMLFAQAVFPQVDGLPPPPAPPPDAQGRVRTRGRATFSVTMSQVIVNVSVTDRNGKPIENLTKDDFELYEDGKPQKLEACEFQRLGTKPLPPLNPATQFAQRQPEPSSQRKAPSDGQGPFNNDLLSKYQDRRLIVMLFDFSSMDVPEQIRARDAALKFLSTQMTASDMVSIMVFGSELKTVQEFTSDRDLLTQVIHSFHVGEAADLSAMADTGADAQDSSGMFTPDDTEFNIFNSDRKLAALQEAAQMLSQYPEKKALVYVSSGVNKTGVDNQSQLEATVNAAVKANVAFFPIDARGLVAQIPGGDATQAGAVGNNLYSGAGQRSLKDSFQDSQETLYTLAADTGGKALLDDNDLVDGLRQVQQDINSYYILAYESSNTAQDGKFRRIQVRLAPRRADLRAKLDYRKGYFAPTPFGKMHESDKEAQLQTALESDNPATDLPLAVEIDYFRLEKNKYFVPLTVRIPGSALAFKGKGSKRATALDFIAQVRDAKNRAADSVRDMIPLKVNEDVAGEVSHKQIEYSTGLTLPPGKYTLKFVARENGEGKVGTFQTSFIVPELNSAKTLRLSSVVLSNQIQPVNDQLGGVKNSKKLTAQDPLIGDNGQKLVPNVTRVFHPGQNLYAFLEIYDPTVPENLPANFKVASIASSLALYSGDKKVFETPAQQLRRFNTKRDGTMDLRFQTPLKDVKPGRYTCQINVIDELGGKFAFPRVSLVVVRNAAQRASL